jgi:hypothetical protein
VKKGLQSSCVSKEIRQLELKLAASCSDRVVSEPLLTEAGANATNCRHEDSPKNKSRLTR